MTLFRPYLLGYFYKNVVRSTPHFGPVNPTSLSDRLPLQCLFLSSEYPFCLQSFFMRTNLQDMLNDILVPPPGWTKTNFPLFLRKFLPTIEQPQNFIFILKRSVISFCVGFTSLVVPVSTPPTPTFVLLCLSNSITVTVPHLHSEPTGPGVRSGTIVKLGDPLPLSNHSNMVYSISRK